MLPGQLISYCLSKEGAVLEFPFGPVPAVIKVGGRIFAEVYDRDVRPQVTLKCDPVLTGLLREKYSGMVDHSYNVVVGKMRRKNVSG